MAQTVIMERQMLSFAYQESMGIWVSTSNPSLFLPVEGTEYTVDWGGTTYNCMAFVTDAAPGNVLLGNPMPLGGEGNGVPFLMSSLADGSGMSIMTFDEGETREVGVWLVEEDVQAPSATVKIKGYSGAEHTYEDVPKVWLAAPESTAENPVLVPFTYGEALDNVEVVPDFSGGNQKVIMPAGFMARSAVVKKPAELVPGNIKAGETVAGITGEYEGEAPETEEKTVAADFSGGDMVLEPSDGKVLSKATVTRPETLVPENIAEGVDIAGIIGTFVGGSASNVVFSKGTVAGANQSVVTVEHGLGVIPELVLVRQQWVVFGTSSTTIAFILYVSPKVLGSSDDAQYCIAYTSSSSTRTFKGYTSNRAVTASTSDAVIHSATESVFKFGGGAYWTKNNYHWIAIAGLT